MYLLTAVLAEEEGLEGALPLADLSLTLGVSVASANQMVRKLERRHLLSYEPYRGVRLTEAGRRVAHRVLRVRRLWGRFLTDRLGMGPDDADALACRLEHVTPDAVAGYLDAFLGHPSVGPTGRPIPPGGERPAAPPITLDQAAIGVRAEVIGVDDAGAGEFLAASGLRPGSAVRLRARSAHATLVEGDHVVAVDGELASRIRVREIGSGG